MYRPCSGAKMADLEFEDFDGGYGVAGASGRTRRMVNIAGAVCSVSLVLGLAIWGYKLAVRDVSGVPVMRAMAGPMRIAPNDPGGDQASNQGLSVNAVAAMGSNAPQADQLTLAPRAVELQVDDAAGVTLASGTDAAAVETVKTVKLQVAGSAFPGVALQDTAVAPLVEDGGNTISVDTTTADAAAPVAPGVRPKARPAALAAALVPGHVQTVSAPAQATEIDPASITVGTRLAQLGAFDTPDLAREKFASLQVEFGDLMVGKAVVIQEAQSGGHLFYRLRAHGFPNEEDARRFCAALQAENADCIPVAQR